MGAVDGNVASVTADPAYDTIAFYDAATEHGAQVVVPPAKTAGEKRAGLPAPAGGVVVDARATRCPAVPPKQMGGDAGFVQKHEVGDMALSK